MKHKKSKLWYLRVGMAALFFIPITLLFTDFSNNVPTSLHALLHLQVLPSILCHAFIVTAALLAFTALFGRFFCSTLCPLGVTQDCIAYVTKLVRKKKYKFNYRKPHNILRYSILVATTILIIVGETSLVQWVDPYSTFGRIATNLLQPTVTATANTVANLPDPIRPDNAYLVTTLPTNNLAIALAIATLLALIVAVATKGRILCNTVCPAGALLSIAARKPLFGVNIDTDKCSHCKQCERACKTQAINTIDNHVDHSKCVTCFNCFNSCPKHAINYARLIHSNTQLVDYNRRNFIATSTALAVALPITALAKHTDDQQPTPLLPPGAQNLDEFNKHCTACHLCVAQCPSRILKPAMLQFGFAYTLKPFLDYEKGYCNYSCTRCSQVCPTGAIGNINADEKHTIQIGVAEIFADRCIVNTEGTDCGACSEHCPTQAVHMVPHIGTLTIPKVEENLCIGCGGCESICPVRPNKAIIVKALKMHKIVETPKEDEATQVEVDEFGF